MLTQKSHILFHISWQNMGYMRHMECDFFCDVLIKINKYAEFNMLIFYFCSYFHSPFSIVFVSTCPFTCTHTASVHVYVLASHSRSHSYIRLLSSIVFAQPDFSKISVENVSLSPSTRFIINCPAATYGDGDDDVDVFDATADT